MPPVICAMLPVVVSATGCTAALGSNEMSLLPAQGPPTDMNSLRFAGPAEALEHRIDQEKSFLFFKRK
jgi:hypothetical protein